MESELSTLNVQTQERTILLVDDEENILSALRRVLRRDGYRILCAGSGQAGLDILATEKVDLIMSDQRMPNMTGTEFLRIARNTSPDSVRIVLSGYTDLQSVTDAINEGAVYKFLTKPWDDEILRLSVKEALRHKWVQDENRMLHGMLLEVNEELAEANRHLEEQAKFAQDALSTHREMINAVPIPVLGIDEGGYLILANTAALELLGPHGLRMGHTASDVLPAVLLPWLESRTTTELSIYIEGKGFLACTRRLPYTNEGFMLSLIPQGLGS